MGPMSLMDPLKSECSPYTKIRFLGIGIAYCPCYSGVELQHVLFRCGNQVSQEDLLVGIEGIDDQAHQLLDVGIEGKCLCHDYRTKTTTLNKIWWQNSLLEILEPNDRKYNKPIFGCWMCYSIHFRRHRSLVQRVVCDWFS